MASQIVFRFWKLIIFFQKVQHEVLNLEIQLILSILWVWHLKIGPKSKKLLESIKNDSNAGKARVWNELRLKLIHQHLALNKRFLKKWC